MAQLVECLPSTRTLQVQIPPEAALLFLLGKKELSLGEVALLCLISVTEHTCILYIILVATFSLGTVSCFSMGELTCIHLLILSLQYH